MQKAAKISFNTEPEHKVIQISGLMGDILKKLPGDTRYIINHLIDNGSVGKKDSVSVLTSNSINFKMQGVMSIVARYTSFFIIHTHVSEQKAPTKPTKSSNIKKSERRYFILGEEYTQKAFYEYLALKPILNGIAQQFKEYDNAVNEREKLSFEIKENDKNPSKAADLKI